MGDEVFRVENHMYTRYTDGSVDERGSGSGVWSEDFALISHLPTDTSVFTTELYAIYCCLSLVNEIDKVHQSLTINAQLNTLLCLLDHKPNLENALLIK